MLLFYSKFLLMLVSVLPAVLVTTKVKANQQDQSKAGPPPAFVAVVPTSIIGDFQGFPYLLETERTTTTTTTTPAPFGKYSSDLKMEKSSITKVCMAALLYFDPMPKC